jgi:hypothetical protein
MEAILEADAEISRRNSTGKVHPPMTIPNSLVLGLVPGEWVRAGNSSSFTTAETVGLNRNNIPRLANRARSIVPPIEAGRIFLEAYKGNGIDRTPLGLSSRCGKSDHVAGSGMGMRGGAVFHITSISAGVRPWT